MSKIYQGKIPFDKEGNLLSYAAGWIEYDEVDNYFFEDTLTYINYSRGRSSALLNFESSYGKKYPMFMSEADIVIPKIVNGKITGKFTFTKKGSNYSIKLYE